MDKWTPAGEGTAFQFSEILQPLEPFRDRVCVVSDLAHAPVAPWTGEDTGGAENHVRAAAVFLSGAHPVKKNEAYVGATVDQIAAQHVGQDTPLPSIELSIEPLNLTCGDAGFTCAYRNTLSWKSATLPLPMENNPQIVFERLFGDGSTDAQRQERRNQAREPARFDPRSGAVAREGSAGRRPPPAARLPGRSARDRAARQAGRCDAVARSRSARRAGRHPGRLRGASEADVRSAGARLQVGDHAHLDADARAREQQRRLPGDRRARGLPQRLAPLERTQEHGSVRRHQPLSRRRCWRYFLERLRRRPTATAPCSITR